ncbi:hypothetical protein HDU97_006539 [Phlyctochytrium planicorne]|nr:hypothetical protein HDU97_006539 [Phlyctochytrium planicorne]
MNLIKITFSLLSLAAISSSAPSPKSDVTVEKRDFCLKYNTQDCRNFKLFSVPSTEIDKQLIIGNASNIDKRVPDFLHGAFYMKGNNNPDEVLSMANGRYDEKENAYYVRVYNDRTWSWDDTTNGKLAYDYVRTLGVTYKLTWPNPPTYVQVTPQYFLPFFLGDGDITITDFLANFTIIPTQDKNFFIRRSEIFGKKLPDYQFIKIVNGDGTRTDRFESDYVERIGKGELANPPPGFSNATHLISSQLLAMVA